MMNRNKHRIAALAALILAALTLAGCGGKGFLGCAPETGDPSVIVVPTDEASPTEPVATEEPVITPEPVNVYVTMRESDGFIRANKNGTYGVGIDGSVRFIGISTMGQHLIYDWENVVDLETNDTTTAALMRDSSIRLNGFFKTSFAEALEWQGTVDLAMGDKHLVGLRTDGTVAACGDNAEGQCDVGEWEKVRKVTAAGTYTAALCEDGIVTTLGPGFDAGLSSLPAADIEAAPDHILLLLTDGTVRSIPVVRNDGAQAGRNDGSSAAPTADPSDEADGSKSGGKSSGNASDPTAGWKDIVKVFAAKGADYAVDSTGRLFTTASFVDETVEDAYFVGASEKHAVVLKGDGTCVSFGDNTNYQGRVGGWRLLPFVTDEGWLLGYGPGTYIEGAPVGTGTETVYTEPATGETRDATFVILGDVNGDGMIDQADVSAVNDHISGKTKLTGAFLRAANVIADSSKPESIDVVDLEKITAEANGEKAIDRFAKTDYYTALLADAKRKNTDALGYIKIKGTNISYPIMYDFNWYYNDHDIDRNEVVRGSIYFYWGKNNRNIVITGHNSRTSGTMFHELHKIQDDKAKLATYKNRLWQINTYGETGYWEVWALYEEPAFRDASQSSQYYNTNFPGTFNSLTEQERREWIDYQLARSELNYSVGVTTEDRFMTLLTCGDDHQDSAKGARLYIFLRWVGRN